MKELQILRDSGKVGSSLEGAIEINANKETCAKLSPYLQTLTEMLIVSSVVLEESEEEEVSVKAQVALTSGKAKCDRCWKIKDDVAGELCSACNDIIKEFN